MSFNKVADFAQKTISLSLCLATIYFSGIVIQGYSHKRANRLEREKLAKLGIEEMDKDVQ